MVDYFFLKFEIFVNKKNAIQILTVSGNSIVNESPYTRVKGILEGAKKCTVPHIKMSDYF